MASVPHRRRSERTSDATGRSLATGAGNQRKVATDGKTHEDPDEGVHGGASPDDPRAASEVVEPVIPN
jgi:hypothetical protein